MATETKSPNGVNILRGNWSNIANAKVIDGNVATTTTTDSYWGSFAKLAFFNFDFTFDDDAIVESIFVKIKAQSNLAGWPKVNVAVETLTETIGNIYVPLNGNQIEVYLQFRITPITGRMLKSHFRWLTVEFHLYHQPGALSLSVDGVEMTVTTIENREEKNISDTATGSDAVELLSADLAANVTDYASGNESVDIKIWEFDFSVAANNTAYVYNNNTGAWSVVKSMPFLNMIYRPSHGEMIASYLNKGNIVRLRGNTFDGQEINSIIKTGYMNFGELDEVKELPAKFSNAVKKLRAFFSDIKADGDLELIVHTERDGKGMSFTIKVDDIENSISNVVRTALSGRIGGKYIAFTIKNKNGKYFWIGETSVKALAKNTK